jgi:hypothetical protein
MVTVGSVDAKPCESAAITLELRNPAAEIVSTYAVPLDLGVLGVGSSVWSLQIPELGYYTLAAIDHGCSEGSRTATAIPIHISEQGILDQVILAATGNGTRWRLYYLGVTRRLTGLGVLEFEEETHHLRNVSENTIRTCRQMLGPPVRELRLVGDKWEEGKHYEYKGGDRTLSSGERVKLESPRARVIRRRDKDETGSGRGSAPFLARLLEAKTTPPAGTYGYIGDPPYGGTDKPFLGHCDTYVIELDVSPKDK